jgi:putative transposase
VVHHSDRGVQYASRAYQQLLASAGCTQSMSRVGDCWDSEISPPILHSRLAA